MKNKFESYSRFVALFMASLLVALVAGCGGGGGGGRDPILGSGLPGLVSLAVTPTLASVPVSGTQQYTATATYSDGSSRNVTASSSWTSANVPLGGAAVATLSPNGAGAGLATGKVLGTSTLTATFGGLSNSATLNVTTKTLLSLLLKPATASIPINGTQQFAAVAIWNDQTSSDVTTDLATTWTKVEVPVVGGTVVATLSAGGPGAGLATGTALGTATITAHYTNNGVTQTAPATLTVSPKTLLSLLLRPPTASIPVNGTQQFAAIATWSDQTSSDVTTDLNTTWTKAENPVVGGTVVATLSAGGPRR